MENMNEAIIAKANATLESAGLGAGALNPDQRKEFFQIIRGSSVLLKEVRFEAVNQKKTTLPKMHIGEPITEKASENTDSGNLWTPDFQEVEISCEKVRSAHNITREALQENLQQANFERILMNAMGERISYDLEMLAIEGDTTLGGTTPRDRLLKTVNGWGKQADSAHVVDFAGANVTVDVFREMKKALPREFRQDPGLRWIMSSGISIDWAYQVSTRETIMGDEALVSGGMAPILGIKPLIVPAIPDDISLVIAAASPATVLSTQYDLFTFATGANTLKIDVDNVGAQTIVFAAGSYNASEVAYFINSAHVSLAGVAKDNGDGRLLLVSPTTGAASEIDIQAVANHCYTEIGLTVAAVVGKAAGAGGAVLEGTFIMLTNPKNLIQAQLDNVEMAKFYNHNYDRFEFRIYHQVDYKIENIAAVVKGKNIRIK